MYAFIDNDGVLWVKVVICAYCDAPVMNAEQYDQLWDKGKAPETCDSCGNELKSAGYEWQPDEAYDGEHYNY